MQSRYVDPDTAVDGTSQDAGREQAADEPGEQCQRERARTCACTCRQLGSDEECHGPTRVLAAVAGTTRRVCVTR